MFAYTLLPSAATAASASFLIPIPNSSFVVGFYCSVLICIQNTQVVLARHFSTLHVHSSAAFIFG
jgi:uncharacterized membrane protein YbhN (UPF0104 family)